MGATWFLYDGDRLITEYDGAGNPLRSYVHGPGADEPLVWYEAAAGWARRYLHTDHQGSVIAIVDDAGTTLAVNAYDPWGIPNAANQGRFGYTGQAWLPELGLWYYKARVYSPTLGRFLQTDPVGYEDQVNLYAYVGNDPVDHADPTGLNGSNEHFEDVLAGRVPPVLSPAQTSDFFESVADILDGLSDFVNSQPMDGGPLAGGSLKAIAGIIRTGAREGEVAAAAGRAAAAVRREANLAKGVPASRLGPSGKPMVHTVSHSTVKAAEEAAQREAPRDGRVRFDAHPQDGQRPHYQAEDGRGRNVQPVAHHCPPNTRC